MTVEEIKKIMDDGRDKVRDIKVIDYLPIYNHYGWFYEKDKAEKITETARELLTKLQDRFNDFMKKDMERINKLDSYGEEIWEV